METHASATTGLLTAEGNNQSGIAGVTWRSDLRLYAGYSPQNRKLPLESGFYALGMAITADAPRVVSFSADDDFSAAPNLSAVDREAIILQVANMAEQLMTDLPNLLVVVAAGNEG